MPFNRLILFASRLSNRNSTVAGPHKETCLALVHAQSFCNSSGRLAIEGESLAHGCKRYFGHCFDLIRSRGNDLPWICHKVQGASPEVPRVDVHLQPNLVGEQIEHPHDEVQVSRGCRRVRWTCFILQETILHIAHEEWSAAWARCCLDFNVIVHRCRCLGTKPGGIRGCRFFAKNVYQSGAIACVHDVRDFIPPWC